MDIQHKGTEKYQVSVSRENSLPVKPFFYYAADYKSQLRSISVESLAFCKGRTL